MLRTFARFPDSVRMDMRRDASDLFGRLFGVNESDGLRMRDEWTPAIEGFREDGHYVIRMALPGVDPKDLEVSITDNALHIKGERRMRDEVKREDYFAQELAYGRFERVVALPTDTEGDKAKAKWTDGILEVRVPMPLAAAPKKLNIEMGRGASRALKAA